jgi:hypothetical protein
MTDKIKKLHLQMKEAEGAYQAAKEAYECALIDSAHADLFEKGIVPNVKVKVRGGALGFYVGIKVKYSRVEPIVFRLKKNGQPHSVQTIWEASLENMELAQ